MLQWLLLLLCPLMMLFCMKGMSHGGKKDCHSHNKGKNLADIDGLQKQVSNLIEQNTKLSEEVKHLQAANFSVDSLKETNKKVIS